jgi:hypothetical protein
MRNWNPFSIFKYLTGSPALHIAVFISLTYHGKFIRGKLGDNPDFYDQKEFIINLTYISHIFCFIMQFVFESGLWEKIFSK